MFCWLDAGMDSVDIGRRCKTILLQDSASIWLRHLNASCCEWPNVGQPKVRIRIVQLAVLPGAPCCFPGGYFQLDFAAAIRNRLRCPARAQLRPVAVRGSRPSVAARVSIDSAGHRQCSRVGQTYLNPELGSFWRASEAKGCKKSGADKGVVREGIYEEEQFLQNASRIEACVLA